MKTIISDILDNLEKELGMTEKECLWGDIEDDQTIFKPLSDAGKKDYELTMKIEQALQNKAIPFKHGLQQKVFIVKNIDLMKYSR
jgi:hypothetical protein